MSSTLGRTAAPSDSLDWRRGLAWILAACFSIAPLVARGEFEAALGDASRSAMFWIPWFLVIGVPRGPQERRVWPLAMGLVLPLFALAFEFDWRADLDPRRMQAIGTAGVLVFLCLGEASFQAGRARWSLYGPIWFLLVFLLPALTTALAWSSGGRLRAEGLASNLASFSPISAMWRDVQPPEGALWREAVESALFCPSTLSCVVLVVLASVMARRGSTT